MQDIVEKLVSSTPNCVDLQYVNLYFRNVLKYITNHVHYSTICEVIASQTLYKFLYGREASRDEAEMGREEVAWMWVS